MPCPTVTRTKAALTLGESLEKYVGQLRAYARVACGCTQKADLALINICNHLVESKADFRGTATSDHRTYLFTLVEEQISGSSLATKSLDKKLFMLIAFEGVSAIDAAHILGLDQGFVERWIAEILR